MWVRGRKGAESISFDSKLFGNFSEVRYHSRDMTLVDVVYAKSSGFCATGAHTCCRRKVTLLEVNIPQLYECTSLSPPFLG